MHLEVFHISDQEVLSYVQPHGFFNCSPAVDVPPNTCVGDSKDNDIKDNGASKTIPGALAAKL